MWISELVHLLVERALPASSRVWLEDPDSERRLERSLCFLAVCSSAVTGARNKSRSLDMILSPFNPDCHAEVSPDQL